MLKEINVSLMNNKGANQLSKSPFTIRNMPDRATPLSGLDEIRSGADTLVKVGVNTDPQNLRKGYLIDLNA